MPPWITSLLREDTPLPMPLVASATMTSWPFSAAARATASPTTPAPTTRTCISRALLASAYRAAPSSDPQTVPSEAHLEHAYLLVVRRSVTMNAGERFARKSTTDRCHDTTCQEPIHGSRIAFGGGVGVQNDVPVQCWFGCKCSRHFDDGRAHRRRISAAARQEGRAGRASRGRPRPRPRRPPGRRRHRPVPRPPPSPGRRRGAPCSSHRPPAPAAPRMAPRIAAPSRPSPRIAAPAARSAPAIQRAAPASRAASRIERRQQAVQQRQQRIASEIAGSSDRRHAVPRQQTVQTRACSNCNRRAG